MSWVKLDDHFGQHPKVVGLPDAAFRLYVLSLCYCSLNETDGMISTPAARLLVGSRASKYAVLLVGAGLWDYVESDTYRIHDYLTYNPSRAENASRREAKRMAGAIGAASRWHDQRTWQNDAPVPVPHPVPKKAAAAAAAVAREDDPPTVTFDGNDANTRCYRAFMNQSPGGFNGTIRDHIDGLLEGGTTPEVIEEACRISAEEGGNKGWAFVSAVVRRLSSGRQKVVGSNGQSFVSGLDIVPNTGLRLVSEDEL